MSTCDEIQTRLSAWIDGEVPEDVAAEVAAHIAACGECRAHVEGLSELDSRLADIASRDAATAERIAVAVLAELVGSTRLSRGVELPAPSANQESHEYYESHPSHERRESHPAAASESGGAMAFRVRTAMQYLAAAAAGFVLAWLLFAPRDDRSNRPVVERPVATQPTTGQSSPEMTPKAATLDLTLARLTVATGAVTLRQPGQSDWSAADAKAPFQCSIGTEVRTGPGVRCELETKDRCTIRLNGDTKLTLRSPREVELHTGQIWCSSPEDVSLNVVTTPAGAQRNPNGAQPLRFTCPTNGSVVSEVDDAGGGRVFPASGVAELSLGGEHHRLRPGEMARVVNGRLVVEPHHADALLATSWMQPLLVLKGHDSPELHERIDRMLATLGRSKLEYLYENEIRSLGEHAVLPLLRFVQSAPARDEPERRRRAMSIVSDMAPSWLVEELIALLDDDDPPIRVSAAMALSRLTGQTQGREPSDWSAPAQELAPTLQLWRLWWQDNSPRYPRIGPAHDAT